MYRAVVYKRGATRKTAKLLARHLRLPLTTDTSIPNSIQWGTSRDSNKLEDLRTLRRAGVRVPPFTFNKDTAIVFMQKPGNIVVGRPSYHRGGSDFRLHTNVMSLSNDIISTHWLKYINIYKEFRIHVFNGRVIGISRKTDEQVEDRILNKYCRNHTNGWRFVLCDLLRIDSLPQRMAINTCQILNMQWGAVDIILGRDGKYYVLEVNSAPSLEEGSTIFQAYVNEFMR
jgi:glutathione synthase/RimK-type ligase-like ATP-grasp enzyme